MGDWGKRIMLTFDRPVSHVTNSELTRWALKNTYGEMIYPVAIGYGSINSVVILDFINFNNIVEPATLECLGCIKMGSEDLPMDPFSVSFCPRNLYQIPSDYEYLALSGISVEGVIAVAFDNKLYGDEYLRLNSVDVVGDCLIVAFNQRYENEYLQLGSVTVAGQYCDINGVPL